MESRHWQDVLTALIGIWVFLMPWILRDTLAATPVSAAAVWSFHIVGLVIAVAGIASLVAYRPWQEMVDVAFGVWLLVSPWFLHFTEARALLWNAVTAGIVVIALACSVLARPEPMRHA